VDPWLIQVGPVAFARAGVAGVRGWRRWWWRIWLRCRWSPEREGAETGDADVTMARAIARPLHWLPEPFGAPACGARRDHALGTIELEAVSCPACRAIAVPMVLQYRANTR